VCAALRAQQLSVLAVGRDAAKLDTLNTAMQGDVETAVLEPDDGRGLRRMLQQTALVVGCAGPFSRVGRVVQDAALEVRRHALDLAGEPEFVRGTLARDAEAKRQGVLLVSGVGFDVAPTDALAVWLSERAGAPIASVRIAYSSLDAEPTKGLGLTMLHGLLEGGSSFVEGAWRSEPFGRHRWRLTFPAPIGKRHCTSVPWGDLSSLPRSTGAATVRAYLPAPALSPVPAARALRWLRHALSDACFERVSGHTARLLARGLPTGDEQLAAVVEVTGQKACVTGWLSAPPGMTAHAAAVCARLAIDGAARGAHTPATAFGASTLLRELGHYGLKWGLA
jgi:short subunit dehydrogenase-like uncharacterized protein